MDFDIFEGSLLLKTPANAAMPLSVGRVDGDPTVTLAKIVFQGSGQGGTQGLISFQTSLGGPAGPVEQMRLHTNGNVGIGVAAPAEKLEVAGKVKATAFLGDGSGLTGATDASKVAKAGDTMTGPLSLPANGLSVGSSQLVVNSGNLGVGTATPQNKLDVNGYIAVEGKHAIRGDDPWLRLNQNLEFTAGVHTPGAFAPNSLNVGGAAGWGNPGPGNAWITGTVGIGTATPIRRLHVHSDDWNAGAEIHASGATAGISFTDREMGRQGDSGGPGERWVWYSQDKLARLWTSGVGDVLTVSKEGTLGYRILEKLDVAETFGATVRAADFNFGHSARRGGPGRALVDAETALVINWGPDWGETGVGSQLRVHGHWSICNGAGGEQTYIGGDGWGGDAQIGSFNAAVSTLSVYNAASGSWMDIAVRNLLQVSDLKDKENVEALSGVLDRVLRLRAVSFRWKTQEGAPDAGRQIGVIAQEVKEVFPETVTEDKRGSSSVAYNSLTAILIEAIKEQQATIKRLEERVAKLEAPARG